VVHWIVAGIADVTVALLALGLIERTNARPAAASWFSSPCSRCFWNHPLPLAEGGHEPGPFEVVQTGAVISRLGSAVDGSGSLVSFSEASGSPLARKLCALALVSNLTRRRHLSRRRLPAVLLGGTAFLEPTFFFALAAVGLSWFGSGSSVPSSPSRLAPSSWRCDLLGLLVQAAFAFSPRWNTHGSRRALASGFVLAATAPIFPPFGIVDGSYGGDSLACSTSVSRYWRSRNRAGGRGSWISGAGEGADAATLATVRPRSSPPLPWHWALGPLERFREALARLPLLVAGGIKLAVGDFPQAARRLFVGLALYGGALILAPRAARSSGDAVGGSGARTGFGSG
jgi:hypothetical protein